MTSPSPQSPPPDKTDQPPAVTEEEASPSRTWIVISVVAVLLLTAGIFGLRALSSDDEPEPTASPSETATESPEPTTSGPTTETPTTEPSTSGPGSFTGKPRQAWTVTPTSLGFGDGLLQTPQESQPFQENTSDVLVVLVTTDPFTEGAEHTVVGVDRVTGAEVWRNTDVQAGAQATCFTLGAGDLVACASEVDATTHQNSVTYIVSATGETSMVQTVDNRPQLMTLDAVGLVTASIDMSDQTLVLTGRDSTSFDEQWTTKSDAGFVPATDAWDSAVSAADGSLAVTIAGVSLVVDHKTGELQDAVRSTTILAPGLVLTTGSGDQTTITSTDGDELLSAVGRAWRYAGPTKAPVPVVGIGGEAADPTTGDELWTVPGASSVGLDGTVVGAGVVLSNLTTGAPLKLVEATTGDVEWTSLAVSGVVSLFDGTLFSETEGTIVGVDMATGKVLWTIEHGVGSERTADVFQVVGATVVVTDDAVATGYIFE